MPFTIAIVADMHAGDAPAIASRKGEYGQILLLRAVQRFNRYLKPDLVLVLGDLTDEPAAARTTADLAAMRQTLDMLTCPWLVIPGNHDLPPERFYQVMPRPADVLNVGPVRLLTFIDPEEPGYRARRPDEGLARLRAARSDGFSGPVIAVQHVPVWPAGLRDLPNGYTNGAEVIAAMAAGGVDLAVSGHWHSDSGLVGGAPAFLTVPALCEAPFSYTLLTLTGREMTARCEPLAMPQEYGLVDYHGHTQFAYCSQNMDANISPKLGRALGLRGLALTEHSGQLYFPEQQYWKGEFCTTGVAGADPANSRVEAYLAVAQAAAGDDVLVGMEVDADFSGRLTLLPEHRRRLQIMVGAVHHLPAGRQPTDPDAFAAQFQAVTKTLCGQGIDILAHPFRIFRWAKLEPPPALLPWLAGVLKENGVAAEINFHGNEPDPAFVQCCLEMGVKLTFGGDAHNLFEVGEFYPQLRLLRGLGVTGDPTPLLADFLTAAAPLRR